MKTFEHWLYLQDEAPFIGCGWRYVSVQLGRKWVYIKSLEPTAMNRRTRWSMRKWLIFEDAMKRYHKRNGSTSRNTFN